MSKDSLQKVPQFTANGVGGVRKQKSLLKYPYKTDISSQISRTQHSLSEGSEKGHTIRKKSKQGIYPTVTKLQNDISSQISRTQHSLSEGSEKKEHKIRKKSKQGIHPTVTKLLNPFNLLCTL